MIPLRFLKLGQPPLELAGPEACAEHLRGLAQGDRLELRPAELSVGGNGSLPALRVTARDGARERFLGYVAPADPTGLPPLPPRFDQLKAPRSAPMRAALASALGPDLKDAA